MFYFLCTIRYISGEYKAKFDLYWIYLKNTWLTFYNSTTWNVYDIINDLDSFDVLVNRTNNPLDRHNGDINNKMHAKPAMVEFVTTINAVSNEKAFLCNTLVISESICLLCICD